MGIGAGLFAGFGHAAGEHNRRLMEIELASREGIAKMWQALAENETLPPEIRQGAIENLICTYTSDPSKPLKKQCTDINALARRNPIPPPALPTPEELPAGGRTGAPTPPEGQLAIPPGVQALLPPAGGFPGETQPVAARLEGGVPVPVIGAPAAPGGQPMGIPPPATGIPPPPAELPPPGEPRYSIFPSTSQQLAQAEMFARREAELEGELTATRRNELQKEARAAFAAGEPFVGQAGFPVVAPPAPRPRRLISYQGRFVDEETLEPVYEFPRETEKGGVEGFQEDLARFYEDQARAKGEDFTELDRLAVEVFAKQQYQGGQRASGVRMTTDPVTGAQSFETFIPAPPSLAEVKASLAGLKPPSAAPAAASPATPQKDTEAERFMDQLADRVERGELDFTQLKTVAQQVGVMNRLTERGSVLVSGQNREMLGGLVQSRNIMEEIKKLVTKLNNDPFDVKSGMLLNSFVNAIASILSRRIYQERGVLNEGDVQRAMGAIPTWSTAALWESYAAAKLEIVDNLIEGGQKSILEIGYGVFKRQPGGGISVPGQGPETFSDEELEFQQ